MAAGGLMVLLLFVVLVVVPPDPGPRAKYQTAMRRTTTAMIKRSATNEIGGRSRSPNLIASQVELQIMQSATKAAIAAILVRCSGIDYQAIRSRAAQLLS